MYIVIHNYYYIVRGKFMGKSKENLIDFSSYYIKIKKISKTNDKYILELLEENLNLKKEIDKIQEKLENSDYKDNELLGKLLEKLTKLNHNNKKRITI